MRITSEPLAAVLDSDSRGDEHRPGKFLTIECVQESW